VYVHVPWCRRRCTYCDFYFVVGRADPRFGEAIEAEARSRAGEIEAAETLYLGGGTPSALGAEGVARVIEGLRRALPIEDDAEVTAELNPEDVDEALARDLARAGVNRASLGVQSFEAETLRTLGRAHSADEAARAVERLRAAGIDRVSVDLIVGVPGDDDERPAREVARAVELGAGHLSTYLLTIEAGTPWEKLMAAGRRADVDEDAQVDAYEAVRAASVEAGLGQYEVSSFARPGEESRHNRIYWSQGSYVGLGPGAHSMRLLPTGAIERRQNARALDAWLTGDVGFDVERLEPEAAFREAVAFGLRDLLAGVSLEDLATRHGASRALVDDVEARLRSEAPRVERDGDRWRITHEGALFADGVARAVIA
jgi:oxygen-independent coproporphyrinogen-3 oxidase